MIDGVRIIHKEDGVFEALVTISNYMKLVTSNTMSGLLYKLVTIEEGSYEV